MFKIFIFILLAVMLFTAPVFAISTNTTLSLSNVINEVNDTKLIIGDWKAQLTAIKKDGLGLGSLLTLLVLLLTSVSVIGVILVMLCNLLQYFTPPETDVKIQKVEDWITKYLIKISVRVLNVARPFLKKKQ